MVVESRIELVNEDGFITQEGEIGLKLSRIDRATANHEDKNINFAMSKSMLDKSQEQRTELLYELGIKNNEESSSRIKEIRMELQAHGYNDFVIQRDNRDTPHLKTQLLQSD